MSLIAERYLYKEINNSLGVASHLPYLSLTLQYQHSVLFHGLLDTGASINVLPYHLGVQLGAVWHQQTKSVQLTGNLANFEARVLVVSAIVANFAPVRLAFAWTQADNVPLLLGQVNFFMEFDVCFYRSQWAFEVKPKN